MGLDISGVGEIATAAQKILSMIFPDKTAEEQSKLAAALALLNAQTDIDKAEVQSTDRLQHWRGGLGWVCVAGYFYTFVFQPISHAWLPSIGPIDITQLATLTLGMLGLGAMHVTEQLNK